MGAACGGGGGEAVDPEMKKIDEQVRARTAAGSLWLPLAPAAVPPPRALPEGGGSGHMPRALGTLPEARHVRWPCVRWHAKKGRYDPHPNPELTPQVKKDLQKARSEDDRVIKMSANPNPDPNPSPNPSPNPNPGGCQEGAWCSGRRSWWQRAP